MIRIFFRSLSHHEANYPRISSQAYSAIVLVCLGYPDQTLAKSYAAIAEALRLAHPPVFSSELVTGHSAACTCWRQSSLGQAGSQLVRERPIRVSPSGVPRGNGSSRLSHGREW